MFPRTVLFVTVQPSSQSIPSPVLLVHVFWPNVEPNPETIPSPEFDVVVFSVIVHLPLGHPIPA